MTCKEKWGYTPEQIMCFDEGRCFGMSLTLYKMRADAFEEMSNGELLEENNSIFLDPKGNSYG